MSASTGVEALHQPIDLAEGRPTAELDVVRPLEARGGQVAVDFDEIVQLAPPDAVVA
jgi:hypothetical protein